MVKPPQCWAVFAVEDANSSVRKPRILSDIPFFGKAFRRKIERQDQQEASGVYCAHLLVQKFQTESPRQAAKTNVIND